MASSFRGSRPARNRPGVSKMIKAVSELDGTVSEYMETCPPICIVNLDLPPRERYKEIGRAYKKEMLDITPIFDDILEMVPGNRILKFLAPLVLRRVFSSEEQEEILGLVEVTGIPLFLAIAYNSFLDTFMGCSSGAVRLAPDPRGVDGMDEDRSKMVHFRNLDWGMEQLRALTIQVHYQRDGVTVAQAVTYAGFVGVLTGVRKNLSISLNFRSAADKHTSLTTVILHKLKVLLGFRPSISSQLRHFLINPDPKEDLLTFSEIIQRFPTTTSSISYVTLCDGDHAAHIEQDIYNGKLILSDDFIAGTNHDVHMETWDEGDYGSFAKHMAEESAGMAVGLIEDSQYRKNCIKRMHETSKRTRSLRSRSRRNLGGGIGINTVASWLQTWPIMNECTHFSCVMDPKEGEIAWVRAYPEAPQAKG